MQVVIVGAGEVGTVVTQSLCDEGHQVVVVEQSAEKAALLENTIDCQVVTGNGSRPGVLEKAGIVQGGTVDCLIACADRDEVNLMAGWIAKRCGVPRVLARVRDMEFTDTPTWAHDLGIDVMISPERAMSREIESLLQVAAAVHSVEIAKGRAGSFAFRVQEDSAINGKKLSDVGRQYPNLGAIVVCVERDGANFIPDGNWVAQDGDLCFVVSTNDHVMQVQELFRTHEKKSLAHVVIVGGGKLGAHLAYRLMNQYKRLEITMVDINKEKCMKLAAEYPRLEVINGDGLDLELMKEIGVGQADGLVVTTDDDQLNVMIGILGGHLACRKTVAVTRRRVYQNLAAQIPVDALINPHDTLASIFLRYVRYPSSASSLSLIDRIDAELIEFALKADNPIVGKKVRDLGLPKGLLLAMVTRNGATLIPKGDTVLQEGDVVSVFASGDGVQATERLGLR